MGLPIAEIPVNWHEVDGSKLSVVSASVEMARDLFIMRSMYLLRLWRVTTDLRVGTTAAVRHVDDDNATNGAGR